MFRAADAPAFITEYLLLLADLELDDNEDEAVEEADKDFFPRAPVSSVAQVVVVSLLSLVEAEEDSNVAAHSPPPSTTRPVLHWQLGTTVSSSVVELRHVDME